MPDKEMTDDVINTTIKKQKTSGDNFASIWEGHPEPGDNARYLRAALASWNLPAIDISDPQQVEQRIMDYFRYCTENDLKPQIVAMANWLGVDRSTLNSWKRGEYRSTTHSPIVLKAMGILEQMWVDYMQNGKINPASGIFLGKNFFGYKDQQDVVVTPNNPLDNLNADEARKKYIEALPDPDE